MTAGSKDHPRISETFPRARLFLLKEYMDHLCITVLGGRGWSAAKEPVGSKLGSKYKEEEEDEVERVA